MTLPIRSLDIGPGAQDDALLKPRPVDWSEYPRAQPKVLGKPYWHQVWKRRVEARRRAGLRLAYHMITATAPAWRKPAGPRRLMSRFWRYVAVAYLLPSGAALATVAALWILRHGL